MKPDQSLLKIGDFARLAATNLRTLRYYEELGLIVPAGRSQGGFRYYRQTDINRVQLIRDLQELGLPLERIRDLISARQNGEARERFLDRVRLALEEQDRILLERARAIEEHSARRSRRRCTRSTSAATARTRRSRPTTSASRVSRPARSCPSI